MSDRGSAGLSVVMLTPVVLALLAFAVLAGRIGAADQDVVAAAQAAARAASLRQGAGDAAADARRAAAATLREAGMECLSTSVETSVGPGTVTATVACAIKLSDLVDLAVPGQTTIRVSASAPVDTYRGGS